jgi:heme/copper-type cytochrome/quinol oxidase subunit 2
MLVFDGIDNDFCGAPYSFMIFQVSMVWLEGSIHSLLHSWTSTIALGFLVIFL